MKKIKRAFAIGIVCFSIALVNAETGNQGDKPADPREDPPPCEWYQWCYWFD